jgi:AraC-like DNA-binding protein
MRRWTRSGRSCGRISAAALPPAPAERDAAVARRARERLLDALDEDIGADELAAASGAADRFRLARAFRAAYGAAPHAWLVQMRLVRARQLLARGGRPAEVAATCGFADQSHLGRWFRRAYRVTPAAYRANCTGVPDPDASMR